MTKHSGKEPSLTKIQFEDSNAARDLFGVQDENIRTIEKKLGVQIDIRGNHVSIRGHQTEVALVEKVLHQLYEMVRRGFPVMGADVEQAIRVFASDQNANLQNLLENSIFVPVKNKVIVPKSANQRDYLEAIRQNDMVFGIGPAGTGKTYLAVAMAVMALSRKQVSRIILSRPAVEAGEKLGFLPGDMYEKVSPYLRPLYDALYDLLDYERITEMVETGVIEIAPLAFMRGRTLNASFIILDEAQNCTGEQMKMFLTRLGFDSKVVVTGDVTQVDLPPGRISGLQEAAEILKGIPGIAFQHFDQRDVVRHRLVSEIVMAYERNRHEKLDNK
ncbi:MAG: PhoH family protein [Deltaproteobacteria bacterium]|nr:PhoH family protein [Deltaproteobacteria bacterium]MBI4196577.1 PhoH family protein [Deltaproteobacteria bacterium]